MTPEQGLIASGAQRVTVDLPVSAGSEDIGAGVTSRRGFHTCGTVNMQLILRRKISAGDPLVAHRAVPGGSPAIPAENVPGPCRSGYNRYRTDRTVREPFVACIAENMLLRSGRVDGVRPCDRFVTCLAMELSSRDGLNDRVTQQDYQIQDDSIGKVQRFHSRQSKESILNNLYIILWR